MWRGAGWGRATHKDQIQGVIFWFRSESGLGLKDLKDHPVPAALQFPLDILGLSLHS